MRVNILSSPSNGNGDELKKRIDQESWDEYKPGRRVRSIVIKTEIGPLVIEQEEQFCQDCHAEWPALFMVDDDIWEQAGYERDALACFDCLKKRLAERGCEFKARFFKQVKLNEIIIDASQRGY